MKSKTKRGFSFLLLALVAFGGLGVEALYAYLVEPLLYGCGMQEWTTWQCIVHWIITCITWILVARYTMRKAVKEQFDIRVTWEKISWKRWIIVIACMSFVLAVNWWNWGGVKLIREFRNLGTLKFAFQYLYYATETVMFLLIIIMAQKALEIWTGKENIPWGGILCALTWGLAHCGTKSLMVGLGAMAAGFCYGVVYLLLNRSFKWSYIVLFIMFAL